MLEILQGTELPLGITLTDEDTGETITGDDVANMEIVIGSIRKTLTGGGITYDAEHGQWIVPLTQEETFSMSPMIYEPQCRLVLNSGYIPGTTLSKVRIVEGVSKEVL